MAKTKKVLLLIVEGSTDETAFGLLFERLFTSSQIKFDIVGGDITTQTGCTPSNVVQRVRERVLSHINMRGYRWTDLARVVQIVDLDGAFVPVEAVVRAEDGCLAYGRDAIYTAHVEEMVERNRRKSASLDALVRASTLTYQRQAVPFAVYFLSRNMEHALHAIAEEVTSVDKEKLARRFQRTYRDDIVGFVEFLKSPDVAIGTTYQASWDFMHRGTNSLMRGSNLHLLLD